MRAKPLIVAVILLAASGSVALAQDNGTSPQTEPCTTTLKPESPNGNPAAMGATTEPGKQAQRNAGVGTGLNGRPIGSTGSGPGSPEHPIDSGSR